MNLNLLSYLIFFPAMNYSGFDLEPSRAMLASDRTLLGLSDGGAHVGDLEAVGGPQGSAHAGTVAPAP